jgi:hypothetical protein
MEVSMSVSLGKRKAETPGDVLPNLDRRLLTRAGFVAKAERALLVQGDGFAAFERVARFLGEIARRHPRLAVVLICREAAQRERLASAFPRARVSPPPLPLALSARFFLLRLRTRLVVLLERPRCSRSLRRALRRTGVSLMVLDADGGPDGLSMLPECVLTRDEAASRAWRASGLPSERICPLGCGDAPLDPGGAARAADIAAPLLARDIKLARYEQLRWSRVLRNSPVGRALLSRRTRPVSSVAELAAVLGNPQTILCLGNGPSSEDARVRELDYDVLFRVNYSWKRRGLLTRPDVVFTGSRKTMSAVANTVFVFQDRRAEDRLVTDHLLHPLRGTLRYSTAERLTDALRCYEWGALRPTNGASMVAVAVALRPQRLVIAGIDLFAHPAGSYPGDQRTPNAYTAGHSRDSELGFLLWCLDRYHGELSIIGDVLEEAWREHRHGARTSAV